MNIQRKFNSVKALLLGSTRGMTRTKSERALTELEAAFANALLAKDQEIQDLIGEVNSLHSRLSVPAVAQAAAAVEAADVPLCEFCARPIGDGDFANGHRRCAFCRGGGQS